MKHSLFSCLLLLLICLTNCTEDEFLSTSYLPTDLELETLSVSNPKVPVLNKVTVEGSKVTLHFTNFASPKKPEGGYELILNGKRTATSITPRLHAGEKNLSMSFTLSNATAYRFQIYARWNSGYVSSNEMSATDTQDAPQESASPEQGETTTPNTVSPPSNPKKPVISNVSFNGSKVTLEFVNFSAPAKPEGGFELMLNGKRTVDTITPRVHSTQKNITMSFTLDNPKNYYYQIYARWNSGYISSEKFYPGQASTPSGPNPNESPSDEDNTGNDENYTNLPSMRILRDWNFNGSTPTSEGGLKFWGNNNGSIMNVSGATDGKAVKFFADMLGSSNYRMELVTTENMPSEMANYFSNSRGVAYTKMRNEVIYQFRIMLSSKWQKDTRLYNGDGYTSLFEFKQDYFSNRGEIDRKRDATFRLRVSKNQYNFIFRATNESFENAPRDSNGGIVQSGKVQMKSIDASADFGQWRLWTVHANWSPGNDGFIRIYRDNQLVYQRENTYTAYDDEPWLGPYMKFGLHDSWFKMKNDTGSKYKEVFVDYVKIGIPR